METEFLKKLQEILETDKPIEMSDEFRNYEEWDSLAYLSVVAFIDEKYKIIIPFEVFRNFQTNTDIFNYIQTKKA